MGGGVASGTAPDGISPSAFSGRGGFDVQSRPGHMAGFVMHGRRTQEGVDQLPPHTEASPCHYASRKGSGGDAAGGMGAPDSSYTDVETDAPTVRLDAVGADRRAGADRERARLPGANGTAAAGRPGDTHGALEAQARDGGRLPRPLERLAAYQSRAHGARTAAKAPKPLAGPRIYGGAYGAAPTHSHYEKAMRRSAHRLVSATTLFDTITGDALATLADLARMYLVRVGEACKARADLAGRAEPSAYDVVGGGDAGPCVDLRSLRPWLDDWRDDVVEPAPARAPRLESRGIGVGPGIGVLGDGDDGDDDVDAIINGIGLGCLLLDGAASEFDGPIPPHLPQTAGLVDHLAAEPPAAPKGGTGASLTPPSPESLPVGADEAEARSAAAAPAAEAADAADASAGYPAEPGSPRSDGEDDTPENMTAHVLHLVSASLAALNPSMAAGSPLHAFFRPASKADPTCDVDGVIPEFEIPDAAFVPAPDYIQSQLARADKPAPGRPLFLAGDSSQRDVLGDIEEQWRQARRRLYPDIFDDAAERAADEMDNAPLPVRRRRISNASEKEAQQAAAVAAAAAAAAAASAAAAVPGADGEKGKGADEMDMDMEMDMGDDVMDIDLGLDLMGGHTDHLAEHGDQEVAPHEMHDASEQRTAPTGERHGMLAGEQREATTTLVEGQHSARAADERHAGPIKELEPEPESELESEPEPIALPVSSGLRGTGQPHWSNEWFSAAMRKRLSHITAQDIVPCDSLFLSGASSGHRHIIDDIARAFVDSEGGGHLHETTPLEGFGPSANTYSVPSASGSALRWTLHHLMQARGVKMVDSLYTGRSSLAGGVAGDGISQYVNRMCSLVKGSVEEEADLVVSGAVWAAGDAGRGQWADRKINPTQRDLMEQLIAGAEKRIPWAQEKLDIHVLESRIAGRLPQPAAPKLVLSASASATPATPSAAPVPSPPPTLPPSTPPLPPAQPAATPPPAQSDATPPAQPQPQPQPQPQATTTQPEAQPATQPAQPLPLPLPEAADDKTV
ncbi:hypothetical protein H4R18_000909 [Coemansia javaensis]|uniref:Bromodomain associated domain-containing protein n=1 Tax=Coemansia javaensis TaxID=2761396 RepID=A0A9W8HL86_9FUNG|nr:hypothetical protein H4R18_000909 [Coemansia javaensis]